MNNLENIYKIIVPVSPNIVQKKDAVTDFTQLSLIENKKYGLLHNYLHKKKLFKFNKNYQNEQGNSSLQKDHLNKLHKFLKKNFPKKSKLVEVGCGKGLFLKLVKKKKYFEYLGFDKTYEGNDKKIKKRYLNSKDRIEADIIILRHTLETIKNPYKFLKMLKTIFSNNALIYIEITNLDLIKKNNYLLYFTHEYINYFTQKSLLSLFSEITSSKEVLKGHYFFCLTSLNSLVNKDIFEFQKKKKWKKYKIKSYFKNFKSKSKTIFKSKRLWIWGASTKGVMYLHYLINFLCFDKKKVMGCIDINKKKQNFYTPSTNIKIFSPKNFYKLIKKNDLVVNMNRIYKLEIIELTKNNGHTIKIKSI